MEHTYLFLGDSITDAHRLWLPGRNRLGDGYVFLLARFLAGQSGNVRILNKGHDGFTVAALLRMLQNDDGWNADFISLLIGINDVAVAKNTGVSLFDLQFSEHYGHVLELLTAKSASILCLGPFLFAYPQEYLLWMDTLQEAETLIREQAARFGIPFVPLQKPMHLAAEKYGPRALTTDGVHLTQQGHRILAGLIRPHLPVF